MADEQGNADFMMFSDIDYSHPDVCEDVKNWGEWVVKELNLSAFRFDAIQHFSERFMTEQFVQNLSEKFGQDKLFLVGEYWVGEVDAMDKYLSNMKHKMSLFDAPLLNNFSSISKTEAADLRKVFDNTLVKARPQDAVTLVTNHDTQTGQTVETPVEGFFKPLAYALILLRQEGYPEVFYGDLYGTKFDPAEPPVPHVADLVLARKLYAYGDQEDYFNEANCVGWVRRGTAEHPAGLAAVMSNTGPGQIKMAVGDLHQGQKWTDVLGNNDQVVEIDSDGYGLFPTAGTCVSVYVRNDADGRDQFGKL